MTTRSSLIIGIAIVLGCLILTLFSNSPTSIGQGPAAMKEGRYQIAVGQIPQNIGQGGSVVVLDTASGQAWVIRGVDNWLSLGKAPK